MAGSTLDAIFDFKYGAADWRGDRQEIFQEFQKTLKHFDVVDGQVIRTVETTIEFASALGRVNLTPVIGPTYLYADKTFRADPVFIKQITRIKTTTVDTFSENSYRVTIDDWDVLPDIHTITHETRDGKVPLALTKNSSLTNLVLRPIVGTLQQECGFVGNTTPLDVPFAETEEEMTAVAHRQRQRDTAVVRELDMPLNPFIKGGHTVRVINRGRSIDKRLIVVGGKASHSADTGRALGHLVTEDWQK